ncbi:elongation factor G, partial [Mycoplasmopsis synoviae]
NRVEMEECRGGDMGGGVGVKLSTSGDTVVGEKSPKVVLEKMVFREPVMSEALEPESKAANEKVSLGLQKLSAEDRSFRTYTDEESGQRIIWGMGELDLD